MIQVDVRGTFGVAL